MTAKMEEIDRAISRLLFVSVLRKNSQNRTEAEIHKRQSAILPTELRIEEAALRCHVQIRCLY